MSLEKQIWQLLSDVELFMHANGLWSELPPALEAFDSQEPFCIDTMSPQEWLQWVFIPRMGALLESHRPLPTRIAITPYYEEAFSERQDELRPLLEALAKIDGALSAGGA
ncbi:YqcC family protein [Leminorella grimontii]|uniref:YqcC family protein n=1 Tax=Leminorella grimontii TaxID=82981 RepID=UPI003220365C